MRKWVKPTRPKHRPVPTRRCQKQRTAPPHPRRSSTRETDPRPAGELSLRPERRRANRRVTHAMTLRKKQNKTVAEFFPADIDAVQRCNRKHAGGDDGDQSCDYVPRRSAAGDVCNSAANPQNAPHDSNLRRRYFMRPESKSRRTDELLLTPQLSREFVVPSRVLPPLSATIPNRRRDGRQSPARSFGGLERSNGRVAKTLRAVCCSTAANRPAANHRSEMGRRWELGPHAETPSIANSPATIPDNPWLRSPLKQQPITRPKS